MNRLLNLAVAALATLSTTAALACSPPPNLSIQQWYGLCQADIQLAYQLYGAGLNFNMFTTLLYQQYAQYPGLPSAMPSNPIPGSACAVPGQTACFSGWMMTCNGSQWLTGALRCN
jgi:hypothetical protein